ncbi:hypothetical protein ACHAXT_001995 [Thalassiosira profunda]
MSAEDSPTSAVTDDVTPVTKALSESALRDNISQKGKNAYYYAHAHRANGPEWDGKIEPRLLGTSSSNLSSAASSTAGSSIASSKAALLAKSNITNYAFLNEEAKVKVYVNLPGVGECADEDISLEFTEQSLCLTVKNYVAPAEKAKVEVDALVADTAPEEGGGEETMGEDRFLAFAKLYGEIESATVKKKADKLILILKKKEAGKPWSSVNA